MSLMRSPCWWSAAWGSWASAQRGLGVVWAQRGVGQACVLWGQGRAVAISVGSHRSREARRAEADQREALVMTWLRGDQCV